MSTDDKGFQTPILVFEARVTLENAKHVRYVPALPHAPFPPRSRRMLTGCWPAHMNSPSECVLSVAADWQQIALH